MRILSNLRKTVESASLWVFIVNAVLTIFCFLWIFTIKEAYPSSNEQSWMLYLFGFPVWLYLGFGTTTLSVIGVIAGVIEGIKDRNKETISLVFVTMNSVFGIIFYLRYTQSMINWF